MTRNIEPEDIEEWAEKNGYDEEDLANFAGVFQVGQLLIQHFVPDAHDDYGDEIDAAHQALFAASPLDPDDVELPALHDQYLPQLALDMHNIDDVIDFDEQDRFEADVRRSTNKISRLYEDAPDDVSDAAVDEVWTASESMSDALNRIEKDE